MPKVTVIMPSLNVRKYISTCIESVLAQTLQDIEILAVDAGSDDGTLEILQDYARRDERIRLIHSDKRSYGYQINLGISLAQGDYIGIVETDDKISADMYETLYGKAIETDSDYVKGHFEKFVDIKQGTSWNMTAPFLILDAAMVGKVVEPCDMPDLLVRDIYLWTGVYKREFIAEIKLNETPGAAFQDQGFLFQTLSSAKRAVYLDKIVYHYRQDNGSSSIFNPKGFRYLVEEYAYIGTFLSDKTEGWHHSYYRRMFNQCIGRFVTMGVSGRYWIEAEREMNILREKVAVAVEHKLIRKTDMSEERWEMLELFLKGTKEIYTCCAEQYADKARELRDVYSIIGDQRAIIFGSGIYGKFFHALLENKMPGVAVAYCDNNSGLWGKEIQGMKVLSPKEAIRDYPDAVYIIASLRSAETIERQLCKYGISGEKIGKFQTTPNMMLFHIPEEVG